MGCKKKSSINSQWLLITDQKILTGHHDCITITISTCCCFCCFHLCIKPLSSKQSSRFCNKRYYSQNVTSGIILLRCVKLMIVLTVVYDIQNLVWKSLSLLSIHPDSSFSYYCLAQAEYEPVRDTISTDISFQNYLTIP